MARPRSWIAEILIQAKRYSNCVPTNDLRALAGSVEEKRATSGVLVTTAWVSPESKAFAARNNRLRIIEGGELKHLLAEYLDLYVRIDLARRPRHASYPSIADPARNSGSCTAAMMTRYFGTVTNDAALRPVRPER
jgi:hypothetical protein